MRRELLRHLDKAGRNLSGLEVFAEDGQHVHEGVLRTSDGDWYPIVAGVPSFLRGTLRPDLSEFASRYGLPGQPDSQGTTSQQEQAKTTTTFSEKWRKMLAYGLSPREWGFLEEWYQKKLGFANREQLIDFYRGKKRILEVGPGSGFNTHFMASHCPGAVFAADVSAGAFTAYANTKHFSNCHVIQADLMDLPFPDGYFDFIIADGVLHHTPDTRKAVEALYAKLQPGGQFFFYVYRKMGAARQFCDAYIREHFTKMSAEECFAACEPLTELGRELSKLKATITLTKPIPVLGIPAGTHDVQRLLYYNFVKCFWNDAFDYDTNNMVNYDWYHPHNAWQHTDEEVAGWLRDLGVTEFSFNPANPNGISTLLTKPAAVIRQAA